MSGRSAGPTTAITSRSRLPATGCATTGDAYDAERRLVSWTAGGVTGKEAYDGEGQRVAHQTTSGVTTITTRYINGVEEIDAASGTVTKYYPAPDGLPQAVRVGSTLSYLARDGLGSVSAALDGNGNVTATALYAPYGQTRYSTGTMPTAKGFTGQRADAASGLDYYGARFYDPGLDQFASADTMTDGLNRFAYVGDSPEARVDPTGKDWSWLPSGAAAVGVVTGIMAPLAKTLSKAASVAQGIEQGRYSILRSLISSGGAVPAEQVGARAAARQTTDALRETTAGADSGARGLGGAGAIVAAGVYDFVASATHQWNADTKYQGDPTMRAIRAYDAGTFRALTDVGSAVAVAYIGGAVGEVGGAVAGYVAGGALGAAVGALIGSAIEPGGGTVAGGVLGWELGSDLGAAVGGPVGEVVGSAVAGYEEGTNPWWQGQLDNATTSFVNSVSPAEQNAETAVDNGAVNLGSAVVGFFQGL